MSKLFLNHPNIKDLLEVMNWRNSARETLRTSGFTTEDQQELFFEKLNKKDISLCFFSFYDENNEFKAFGGFTDISLENRSAEISLIVNPIYRYQGIGIDCLDILIEYAFKTINLEVIYGEAYHCNPAWEWWKKIVIAKDGKITTLPNRKYWNGKYWDSLYFSIKKL